MHTFDCIRVQLMDLKRVKCVVSSVDYSAKTLENVIAAHSFIAEISFERIALTHAVKLCVCRSLESGSDRIHRVNKTTTLLTLFIFRVQTMCPSIQG